MKSSHNLHYEKVGNKEPVCIEDELPFEIPDSWEWVRLGNISTYAQSNQKIKATNADKEIWQLDLEDIEKGGKILKRKTVGECNSKGDKTLFKKNNILYSKLRPYLLKILIAPEDGICTTEIVPFNMFGGISNNYLVYLLKTPHIDFFINSNTYGVKMPRVSSDIMINLLIPLPPLEEQQRIVDKIEEVEPLIDKYKIFEEQLYDLNSSIKDNLKKSILQYAVEGKLVPQDSNDEPASVLLERVKKEKQKLIQEGKIKKDKHETVIYRRDNSYYEKIDGVEHCIDDEIPFDIPDSWTWCRLNNLFSIKSGLSYKKSFLNAKTNRMVRVLRGGNIYDGKIFLKNDDVLISSDFVKNELYLKRNWLITPSVTSLEHIGKTAYIEQDYYDIVAGGFILNLLPHLNNNILSQFVNHVCETNYYKKQCQRITHKSGQAFYNLSREKLLNVMIPIPPLNEQNRINDLLNIITNSLKQI
ncbi:MAG: restriction endonuclease subunit S [Erysipelotrichaceae bacterium]|nr:restriction endonuclease subunit S [Erysipelotrichaceae bacterium]